MTPPSCQSPAITMTMTSSSHDYSSNDGNAQRASDSPTAVANPSYPQQGNETNDEPTTSTMAASCRAAQGHGRPVHSAATTDVNELVVKAKKAAASLWMILHAQTCDDGELCPHTQCPETRVLLQHVQTCPSASNPSAPCPTAYKGCNESRKLLAHYQKCKELRTQQTLMGKHCPPKGSCLVCSLMARYAKNKDASLNAAATLTSMSMRQPPVRQRPRSESCPEPKGVERKSRTVKFASCLRTTRYYHPDKAYCASRRPRSASLGSNFGAESIAEEGGEETTMPHGP
jgi:hypothetical protein